MKYLMLILLIFFVTEDATPSFTTQDSFDGYFMYNENELSKDEIIQRIHLETKTIISEIELKLYYKKQPFKSVK